MKALTMKFGGSSVGTTTALTQVLSIVLHEAPRWQRMLLVVSALDGVTDALIEAAHLAQLSNRRGYRRITATLRTRHMALVEKLPFGAVERTALQADLDRLLFDMLNLCETIADDTTAIVTPEKIDAIISVGERLASRIVAALLRQNNIRSVAIDTTDLIVTNDVHGNATPNMEQTRKRVQENLLPMLDRKIVPVLTGFIGSTPTGKPTTLGRGGSDYTASILSVCAAVDEVWIWTDVDGIMSTDPREVNEARVIPELSYAEMAEMAYFGARILHSRMVGLLQQNNIPLKVKNIFKPQQPGTRIFATPSNPRAIKAVTTIHGIGLEANQSGPLAHVSAMVDEVLFNTIGNHADVMISAQSSLQSFLCFVIPTSAGPDAVHTIQTTLESRLHELPGFEGWQVHPVSIVTAVGSDLNGISAYTAQVLRALDGLRLRGMAQGPAGCSFSVIVDPRDADAALRQIHSLVVNSDSRSDHVPTG